MKCKKLIQGLPIVIKGAKDVLITGISQDARQILPGYLFIACKQENVDQAKMIFLAVANGACAILTDIYDPFLSTTQLICSDISTIIPEIANRYYQSPSQKIKVVGVTGLHGTAITSYLLRYLCANFGLVVLNSMEKWKKAGYLPANLSEDNVIAYQRSLREMVIAKKQTAVIEAPLPSIIKGKFTNIAMDTIICTKPLATVDPLQTKQDIAVQISLFNNAQAQHAIFASEQQAYFTHCVSDYTTYGIHPLGDVQAKVLRLSLSRTTFLLCYGKKQVLVAWSLVGMHAIYHALPAVCYALSCGITLEKIGAMLCLFPGVPGRMQRVHKHIFVDLANTVHNLEQSLCSLRFITKQPIVLLFGCKQKHDVRIRYLMGKIAKKYADFVILTSDNPGTEDPHSIILDVEKGLKEHNYFVCIDRKQAIDKAVQKAKQEKAVLLIAGKGHEKTQKLAHQTIPFDDVAIAKQAQKNLLLKKTS